MKILYGKFKNFKGLRKISVNGEYSIEVPESVVIHSLYGENGIGKSTIIKNLNPFIFPNGYTGKSVEDFVHFPAEKEVIFTLGEDKYRSKISYLKKGDTSAKLYIIEGDKFVLVEGFESGKGNTYTDLVEKLLLVTQKNVSKINFIGQNTNAIIEAKATERKELIAPLIDGCEEHDEIFEIYQSKEDASKESEQALKAEINILSGKVGKGFVDCSVKISEDIKKVELRIKERGDELLIIIAEGKSNRKRKEVILEINRETLSVQEQMDSIKSMDKQVNFPEEMKVGLSVISLEDAIIEKNKALVENKRREELRVVIEDEKKGLEYKLKDASAYNDNLLQNNSDDEISKFIDSKIQIKVQNDELNKYKKELFDNRNAQMVFINNKKIEADVLDVIEKKVKIETDHDEIAVKNQIEAISKDIYKKSTNVDEEVVEFVGELKKVFTEENDWGEIDKISNDIFGGLSGFNLEQANEIVQTLAGDKSELQETLNAMLENIRCDKQINELKAKIVAGSVDLAGTISEIEVKIEELVGSISAIRAEENPINQKNKYIENKLLIANHIQAMNIINSKINDNKAVDMVLIDKVVDLSRDQASLIDNNANRLKYREMVKRKAALDKDSLGYNIIEISSAIDALEGKYLLENEQVRKDNELLITKNTLLERNNVMATDLSFLEKSKRKLEGQMDKTKVYNTIKLYARNIKDTIISSYMAEMTETANKYLATGHGSSMDIHLSIEQSGQSFKINATQGELGVIQEVNTLSGAESATVNRALATAIAFSNPRSKYNCYAFDEADSALSQTNKRAFSKNILDISKSDKVDQLFIISQDDGISDYIDANKITLKEGL